jgi:hypothetical protein
MNIAAAVLIGLGLFLNIAAFVLMGMPKLVTAAGDPAIIGTTEHNYAMYANGFKDIFAGLGADFKNLFNFKGMLDAANSNGTSMFAYIVLAIAGVSAIMLVIHLIMLIVRRKGGSLGPGLLYLVTIFTIYVMLVIYLVPVAMGRTFQKWDSATSTWVAADETVDFKTMIASCQAGGYADNAVDKTKQLLLMPLYMTGGAFLLSFIGFILTFVFSCKKKKVVVNSGATASNGQPIQVVVQNVPGKDRIIVIPGPAPREQGPQMVQYLNTDDGEEAEDPYATSDDVRQAIRKELQARKNGTTTDDDSMQQVPPASNYMTEDEARQAIRDAIAQKAAKK